MIYLYTFQTSQPLTQPPGPIQKRRICPSFNLRPPRSTTQWLGWGLTCFLLWISFNHLFLHPPSQSTFGVSHPSWDPKKLPPLESVGLSADGFTRFSGRQKSKVPTQPMWHGTVDGSEIRRLPVEVGSLAVYPIIYIIYRFLVFVPGGGLGFQPSTEWLSQPAFCQVSYDFQHFQTKSFRFQPWSFQG